MVVLTNNKSLISIMLSNSYPNDEYMRSNSEHDENETTRVNVSEGSFVVHVLHPITIQSSLEELLDSISHHRQQRFQTREHTFRDERRQQSAQILSTAGSRTKPVVPLSDESVNPETFHFPKDCLLSVDRIVTVYDNRLKQVRNRRGRHKDDNGDGFNDDSETDYDETDDFGSQDYEGDVGMMSNQRKSHPPTNSDRYIINDESANNLRQRKRTSSISNDPPIIAKYARLTDSTGWICLYEGGVLLCKELPIETKLFAMYIDNIPNGIIGRFHPLDDVIELLPIELAYTDRMIHFKPLTQIYCDSKVTHPVTGICFYRVQMMNSTFFPVWVHDRQPGRNPKYDPDIYKLLPASKIQDGTIPDREGNLKLYAYEVVHGAVIRSRPDCTEQSKHLSSVVKVNDIVVGNLIRESPIPENGNGPFIRLTTPNIENLNHYWIFEKKLHQPVLRPIPIQYGRWEFQVVLNSSIVDPANETLMMCRAGVFVYTQPLDRCLSTAETTIAFLRVGDYIQCDCKIEQQIVIDEESEDIDEHKEFHGETLDATSPTSQKTTNTTFSKKRRIISHFFYRAMLSDGRYGWVADKDISDIVRKYRYKSRKHFEKLQQQHAARLQLLSNDEFDRRTEENPTYGLRIEDDSSWTPEYVRGVATAAGIKEIACQPIGNVIVFLTEDFVQVNVFCSTKTVQTVYEYAIDNQEEQEETQYVDIERSFSDDSYSDSDDELFPHKKPPQRASNNNQMSMHHRDAKVYYCYRKCNTVEELYKIMKITLLEMISSVNRDEAARCGNPVVPLALSNNSANFSPTIKSFADDSYYGSNYCEEKKEESCRPITDFTAMNIPMPDQAFQNTKINEMGAYETSPTLRPPGIDRYSPQDLDDLEYEIRKELIDCDIQILQLQKRREELWEYTQFFDRYRKARNRSYPFHRHPPMNFSMQLLCAMRDRIRKQREVEKHCKEVVQGYHRTLLPIGGDPIFETDKSLICQSPENKDKLVNCASNLLDEGFEIIKRDSFLLQKSDSVSLESNAEPYQTVVADETYDTEEDFDDDVKEASETDDTEQDFDDDAKKASDVEEVTTNGDVENTEGDHSDNNGIQSVKDEEKTNSENDNQLVNEIVTSKIDCIDRDVSMEQRTVNEEIQHNNENESMDSEDGTEKNVQDKPENSDVNATFPIESQNLELKESNTEQSFEDNEDKTICDQIEDEYNEGMNSAESNEDPRCSEGTECDDENLCCENGEKETMFSKTDSLSKEPYSIDTTVHDQDDDLRVSKSTTVTGNTTNHDDSNHNRNLGCNSQSLSLIDSRSFHGAMTRLVSVVVSPSSSTVSQKESPTPSIRTASPPVIETDALPQLNIETPIESQRDDNKDCETEQSNMSTEGISHSVPSPKSPYAEKPDLNNSSRSFNNESCIVINRDESDGSRNINSKTGINKYRSIGSIGSGARRLSNNSSPTASNSGRSITGSSSLALISMSSGGSRRRGVVCGQCFQMFSGKYSRDIHCREVHKLFCRNCDKIFPSKQELKFHRC